MTDIPSMNQFVPQDAKAMNVWLAGNHQDRGFQAFIRARDRQISQFIVTRASTVSSEKERIEMAEYVGRRLELIRLQSRSQVQFEKKVVK